MKSSIKIYDFDFDKIIDDLELELDDNSIEFTFYNTDLESRYFDDEKAAFVEIEANLLEMIFYPHVCEILNKYGLTDDYIRDLYKKNSCFPCSIYQDNESFDASIFKIKFEIEKIDMPDVDNPLQIPLFT